MEIHLVRSVQTLSLWRNGSREKTDNFNSITQNRLKLISIVIVNVVSWMDFLFPRIKRDYLIEPCMHTPNGKVICVYLWTILNCPIQYTSLWIDSVGFKCFKIVSESSMRIYMKCIKRKRECGGQFNRKKKMFMKV